MSQRLLSSPRPWWNDAGLLVFVCYLLLALRSGGQRFDAAHPAASFGGVAVVLILGFPYLRASLRSRPFCWSEVVEETDGTWTFRRKQETLRVRPEEVRQVFPFGYGGRGLLVLRLRAGGEGRPKLLMFPGGVVEEGGRSLPVLEYLSREVARASSRLAQPPAPPQGKPPVRISSPATFWIKHVAPWAGFSALGLWTAWRWSTLAQTGEWSAWAVVIPVLLGIFGFVLHHEFLSNLVDEVWDAGDTLRVRNRGREHLLPLSEVERLDYRPMEGLHWIVVRLKTRHALGKQWVFIPQGRGSFHGWSPELDALEERTTAAAATGS